MRPIDNPPNPWLDTHVEWLDEVAPPDAKLEVYEEQARSILAHNESPDIPFRWSLNPYRGCYHACAYCYARPSHELLGFGAGTDFERKLVVKTNAAALLREHFERPSWSGETISLSGVTDPYQPLEAHYRVTRACLEVCLDYRNPVQVITKGALIRRDLDLLRALHEHARVSVAISLPILDAELARALEPGASPPARRLAALAELAAAGLDCGVSLGPVLPGLNDAAIPDTLQAAAEAGARWAFLILLRLPGAVESVFVQRLHEAVPLRAAKLVHAIEDMRGGKHHDPRFGARMRGEGPRWAAIEGLFAAHCRRLGLAHEGEVRKLDATPSPFRRPKAQLELW